MSDVTIYARRKRFGELESVDVSTIQNVKALPLVGARWFIALFVLLIVGWAYFIYLHYGNYDFAGNRMSRDEVSKREKAIQENVCRFSSGSNPREVECSRLDPQRNVELNELLRTDEYSALTGQALLEEAQDRANSYIYWRDFEPELGGGGESLQGMVVAAAISAFCLSVGLLLLIVCIPIYLFSSNKDRARKAGGLAKTALGFIVAVGTTVAGGFALT